MHTSAPVGNLNTQVKHCAGNDLLASSGGNKSVRGMTMADAVESSDCMGIVAAFVSGDGCFGTLSQPIKVRCLFFCLLLDIAFPNIH